LWTVSIALFASQAWAQAQPFPTSFDRGPLLSWITSQTQLHPQDVVSVGATDIIAVQSLKPDAAGAHSFQIRIHAEVVSAKVAEMEGYKSWSGLIKVDCDQQALQVREIRNFAERNLQGAWRDAPANDEWLRPGMGSQLFSVVRTACEPGYPRPFGSVAVAQTGGQDEAVAVASASPVPAVSPVSAAAPAFGPAGASAAIVQISAAPTETLAEKAIEQVTARFAAGRKLTPGVERVVRNGKTLYRARLRGFDSVQDAQDFCRTLKASAQDCYVGIGAS
jgi:hypothetical protein